MRLKSLVLLFWILTLAGVTIAQQEDTLTTPPPSDVREESLEAPQASEPSIIKTEPITPGEVREESAQQFNRLRKFLSLTIGIESEERLPTGSGDFDLKGDFTNVTNVTVAKELGVLRFEPKKEGVATLTLHDNKGRLVAEYRIDVKKSNLDKIVREIQSLLGDIEGIQIKIVNNRAVIDGQILLAKDMIRINSVIAQYDKKDVSSLVSLSPLAQKKIAEIIEREINNPEITVRAVNDKYIIEGFANNDDEKARASIIAQVYIPEISIATPDDLVKQDTKVEKFINLIKVKEAPGAPTPKIIQLVIHYVELNKDYTKGFRFQWTPELKDDTKVEFGTGSAGGSGVVSSITGTISNLLPKLNWAKQHGHARVLESTSLIIQDGKQGSLSSKTRIPTTVAGPTGPLPGSVDVGIDTAITPTILGDRSDTVDMDIKFSIGALVSMSGDSPIVSDSKINTFVSVRSGQSAAIGGLITNNGTTSYNRLPSNVSNPLLSLYASKDFVKRQSQFVVFITPVIKSSASSGSEKIKRKFRLKE